MERLGINAVMNSGAVYLNGKSSTFIFPASLSSNSFFVSINILSSQKPLDTNFFAYSACSRGFLNPLYVIVGFILVICLYKFKAAGKLVNILHSFSDAYQGMFGKITLSRVFTRWKRWASRFTAWRNIRCLWATVSRSLLKECCLRGTARRRKPKRSPEIMQMLWSAPLNPFSRELSREARQRPRLCIWEKSSQAPPCF